MVILNIIENLRVNLIKFAGKYDLRVNLIKFEGKKN